MNRFLFALEIIGTISFAISGATMGLKKDLDLFGICILGLTVATGGGVLRDFILGITPPTAFIHPVYLIIAVATSLTVFIPLMRKTILSNRLLQEHILFLADSVGLGIFTALGVRVAIGAGFYENFFLVIFVATLTGVGGGLLRDVMVGEKPYIFTKHIYACAAIAGAVICYMLWNIAGEDIAVNIGFIIVLVIRILSAKLRLNLPHVPREE